MYKAKDFDDALDKAERLIADGGYGHTSSVYLNEVTETEKIEKFSHRMKTCRILINTPSSHGGITLSLLRRSHSAAARGEEIP